ncbi:MAG: hypothetical protein V4717_01095 [Bacteroidota bacterium]
MDKLLQSFLISITIAIPAIIGLYRYRAIDKRYRPFIWICCAITLNELLMFVLINMKIFTFITYNVAVAIVCTMYLWLFKSWGLFSGKKMLLLVLFSLLMIMWVADHFLLDGYRLDKRTTYFRVCYSLTLVILSVNSINRLIISEKKNLLQNSQFLICISLVIYFTYRIIVDAFSLKGMSQHFLLQLGDFSRYLLVGLNLIFALAALWIPSKKSFTIQF